MKSLNLDCVFPTRSQIKDFTNLPCDRNNVCLYYSFQCLNKRLCIHYKGGKYHVMAWNFVPHFDRGTAQPPVDTWYSVYSTSDFLACRHLFFVACDNLLTDFINTNSLGHRVSLEQIISDLCLYKQING